MKTHLPQVFVIDVGMDHDFELYFYEDRMSPNCPICSPQPCIKTGHGINNLEISKAKINETYTRIIPDHEWFDEMCKEVRAMKEHMWSLWEIELFRHNKNIFLIRKNLGNGTSETGFLGREGVYDNPDCRFDEPTRITKERYAKLTAFW
jgi:hypothetical protein